MQIASIGAAEAVITVLIVLLVWLLPSVGVAHLAERKGRNFALWLTFALLFSWVALLLAILILPSRRDEESTAANR